MVYTSDSSDGTRAAGATEDDGHLEPPLIDPGTAKAVQSELDTGARASDPDKG